MKVVAVDVVWLDSSHENGWIREPRTQQDLRCFTRGWLVGETRTAILVSAHATATRDGGPLDQFHSPMTIPKAAITSLRRTRRSPSIRLAR